MICAIVVKPVGKGIFAYYGGMAGATVQGRSRQPLLDACRQLKRMGEPAGRLCAMYYLGASQPAARAIIGKAAELDVKHCRFRRVLAPQRVAEAA